MPLFSELNVPAVISLLLQGNHRLWEDARNENDL